MDTDEARQANGTATATCRHDGAAPANEPGAANSVWIDEKVRTLLAQRIETFWNRDQLDTLVAPQLRVPPGGAVLDVGCGPGGLTIPLARALPTATVVGFDLEEDALAHARSLASAAGLLNAEFRVGDALALPVPDHEADATACQTLLTHVSDPAAVLREMIRATRPGGAILVVEYDTRGTFIRSDDVPSSLSIEERVWRIEMTLRFIEGKRTLGRGDEQIGSRVPLLLHDLGCTIEDVRIVDRAWRALPPYHDPRERIGLETLRTMLEPESESESESVRAWSEACYRAGGASEADLERMRRLDDEDPWSNQARTLLDAGAYRYVSALVRFATVARTPEP